MHRLFIKDTLRKWRAFLIVILSQRYKYFVLAAFKGAEVLSKQISLQEYHILQSLSHWHKNPFCLCSRKKSPAHSVSPHFWWYERCVCYIEQANQGTLKDLRKRAFHPVWQHENFSLNRDCSIFLSHNKSLKNFIQYGWTGSRRKDWSSQWKKRQTFWYTNVPVQQGGYINVPIRPLSNKLRKTTAEKAALRFKRYTLLQGEIYGACRYFWF